MTTRRRELLIGATAAVAAGGSLPLPAIAGGAKELKMVTSGTIELRPGWGESADLGPVRRAAPTRGTERLEKRRFIVIRGRQNADARHLPFGLLRERLFGPGSQGRNSGGGAQWMTSTLALTGSAACRANCSGGNP